MKLKLTTFDCVPEHMKKFTAIAHSKGLSRSALLRLMVAEYVRREAKTAAAGK
jgi:hypothetical protein